VIHKYLLAVDEQPLIGLTFNDQNNIMAIGGKLRSRFVIESIIERTCEQDDEVRTNLPQVNKIRYEIKKDWEQFKVILESIKQNGVIVTETERLGRIMI